MRDCLIEHFSDLDDSDSESEFEPEDSGSKTTIKGEITGLELENKYCEKRRKEVYNQAIRDAMKPNHWLSKNYFIDTEWISETYLVKKIGEIL